MKYSGLTTKLKLAYAPINNYDFTIIKNEKVIQDILDDSMLYVIAQRPLLTFENVHISKDETILLFDIIQQGTRNKVKCSVPIYQNAIENDKTKRVNIRFGSYNKNWKQTELPLTDVNSFQFYDNDMNFLLWLSPDKFLHDFYNNFISATVEEDYKTLTKYNVHYVGKATDQDIWKRLTGHDTLQAILSLEAPFNYGTLPTHEIVLLLFRIEDKLSITIFDGSENQNDFIDNLLGKNYPSDKDVSLDAEKVLIKLLNPAYNRQKFSNYPKSTDGLYKFNFNRFAYQILENITLVYSDGEIISSISDKNSDLIVVEV